MIPAIIRKCFDALDEGADEVVPWGTGTPTREFLYVDDAAEGVVLALERHEGIEPINLGPASEISIERLAETIGRIVGFTGRFVFDPGQPDGQPRRAVDGSKANRLLGWSPRVGIEEGLRRTVEWYRDRRRDEGEA